jgi:hypothetical protein
MRRHATVVLTGALVVGGLAAVAVRFGESLWALTAPPDRLGAVVADAEPGRAGRRASDSVAAVVPPPARADSTSTARASRAVRGADAHPMSGPVARVGARITVPDQDSTETVGDGPSNAMPGEPAFTVEVQGGRTIYRMNGELIVDPDHPREDLVENGFEYRFGKRGLEKFKLWEVAR